MPKTSREQDEDEKKSPKKIKIEEKPPGKKNVNKLAQFFKGSAKSSSKLLSSQISEQTLSSSHSTFFSSGLTSTEMKEKKEISSSSNIAHSDNIIIIEEEKTIETNIDSEGSVGSDEAVMNSQKNNIFATAYTTRDCKIIFTLNSKQRPPTYLGKNIQGDHITSYIAIISAILSSTDKHTIQEAASKLKNLLERIFPSTQVNISSTPIFEIQPLYTSGWRNDTVAAIKKSGCLDLDTLEQLNGIIKFGKVTLMASDLARLANEVVQQIQGNSAIVVFSQGRVNKKKDEANLAKAAARMLMAFNRLCEIEKLDNKQFEEQIEDFISSFAKSKKESQENQDSHVIRYGLKAFYLSMFKEDVDRERKAEENVENDFKRLEKFFLSYQKSKKSKIKTAEDEYDEDDFQPKKELFSPEDCLKHMKTVLSSLKKNMLDKPTILAEQIGNLYDYPYTLKFNLTQAFPEKKMSEKDKISYIEDKTAFYQSKFTDFFPRPYHLVKLDTVENEAIIMRKDMTLLLNSLSRHLGVIETAFPELNKQENYQKILYTFLNQDVLIKAEWHHLKIAGKVLTAKTLLQSLKLPEEKSESSKLSTLK